MKPASKISLAVPEIDASVPSAIGLSVRPRLLFLTPFFPDPSLGGASVRVHGHVSMVSHHFDVVLVILSDHPERTAGDLPADIRDSVRDVHFHRVQPICSARWEQLTSTLPFGRLLSALNPRPRLFHDFFSEGLAREIGADFGGQRFDAVHAFRIATLPLLRQILGNLADRPSRIFLDLDDLESKTALRRARAIRASMGRQIYLLHRLDAPKLASLERQCAQIVDFIGVCSALDRDEFNSRYGTTKAKIVPNVVRDPGPSGDLPNFDDERIVMFVGNFHFYPNVEAINHFIADVMPRIRELFRERIVVKLVGHGATTVQFDASANPEVEIHDGVPDLCPYYRKASVVVAPIRSGGGTRIKIIEALSYGKAVVSTRIGAEGLDVADDCNILLRDDPLQFAEACVALIRDRDMQSRIGQAGRRLYLDKYCGAAVETALIHLLKA